MKSVNHLRVRRGHAANGFTLMEVMVVLTIMGVLICMAVPSFQRAIEQSRADLAAANLRAIWSAQRLYWLEYRAYAADLPTLQSSGLLDAAIVSAPTFYIYHISAADTTTFTATATRAVNARWNGVLSIDDTGQLTGVLSSQGDLDISPGYQ